MTEYDVVPRADWLDLADRFYAQLQRSLAPLSYADWKRPTPYLGWRARDVLAHMTSAIPVNFRQVLDWALAVVPAPPPEFDTFRRNAREVARRRTAPTSSLTTCLTSATSSSLAGRRRSSTESRGRMAASGRCSWSREAAMGIAVVWQTPTSWWRPATSAGLRRPAGCPPTQPCVLALLGAHRDDGG